jgi:hypothetical protein
MILKYQIKFYDYWHLSSGLSAGAKLDSIVVKDKDGLPYASGKTIKGLIKEQAELLNNNEFINRCFGSEGNNMGECYFSNAVLSLEESAEIKSNHLQDNLYDIIASTQIGENGIALDNSLREIEVVIPLSLYGEIRDIPSQDEFDKIKASLIKIKRMGLNRNRGLGRCEFSEILREEEK